MNKIYGLVVVFCVASSSALIGHAQSNVWDDIEREFGEMQRQVNQMVTAMQKKFTTTAKALTHAYENPELHKASSIVSFDRVSIDKETIKADDGKYTYNVSVYLPGYSKENINVTIDKQRKGGSVLVVKAKKDFQGEEKAKTGVVTRHAESYSSLTRVNDRKQSIEYENGSVIVQIELPANVDSDGAYDMTFDNARLSVTFSVKGKNESMSRVLTLTD